MTLCSELHLIILLYLLSAKYHNNESSVKTISHIVCLLQGSLCQKTHRDGNRRDDISNGGASNDGSWVAILATPGQVKLFQLVNILKTRSKEGLRNIFLSLLVASKESHRRKKRCVMFFVKMHLFGVFS